MTRAISSVVTKKKHKKILKLAKGYRGRASTCYRIALQRVENALRDAYKDRRRKKRDLRGLWIQQLNAAVRQDGLVYSKFVDCLKKASVELDRKILAYMANYKPECFKAVLEHVTK
ncbi:50S ribosomal protein L20 [Candidatus Sneabacter namystus]|uniref:Large ribosomal subunit protein bL20 n=1 Tax=Candidatus Sneabacter namystus TaxID=2601646 RepID=A0A5C0UHS9_9RICK|nr:50S ribosomal protein L20 [Candidatus Sneabacter namystus]QEK39638.1 50S ribosomal protein L20 [Candidatus Sneabacter namystus]